MYNLILHFHKNVDDNKLRYWIKMKVNTYISMLTKRIQKSCYICTNILQVLIFISCVSLLFIIGWRSSTTSASVLLAAMILVPLLHVVHPATKVGWYKCLMYQNKHTITCNSTTDKKRLKVMCKERYLIKLWSLRHDLSYILINQFTDFDDMLLKDYIPNKSEKVIYYLIKPQCKNQTIINK